MEYFDLINPDGSLTGTSKPRHAVHRDGDWHRAVHIWLINDKQEILLQKRAPDKDSYPNLWDISCAGHIDAGSEPLPAALREAKEELGLTLTEQNLEFLTSTYQGRDPVTGTIDNEVRPVYLVVYDAHMGEIYFQREEITEVTWVNYREHKKNLDQHPEQYTPHIEEYKQVFAYLQKRFAT